jgi:pimeloyl-ACP methyl ester carboxylesterase
MADRLEARYARFIRDVASRSETIDGVTWRWFEEGEGSQAVVILPGAVGGADLFFILFEELRPLARVIAVDLPFVKDATSAMVQMDRLLGALGVRHAIFLGASFSGLFVQAYARRYADRTRALILSHTAALDPARAAKQRGYARWAGRLPVGGLRTLLRLVVRLLLRRVDDRQFWIERYDEALGLVTRDALVSRYLLEASIEDLRDEPWRGDVLVIHSDNDVIAKPEDQARLREQYPGAEWIEFKGAGHSAYTSDPLAYAAVIRTFLSRIIR